MTPLYKKRGPKDRLKEDRLKEDRLKEDKMKEDKMKEDKMKEDEMKEDELKENMTKEKRIEKFMIPVIVALIGFGGSIYAAKITATNTARTTAANTASNATAGVVDTATSKASSTAQKTTFAIIRQQEQRTSGGTIDPNGKILNRIGRPYTVSKEAAARFRITFDQPFDRDPVVLVSAHQEKLPTLARVEFSDQRSIVVSTHRNRDDALEAGEFSFMVLESVESHKPQQDG